MKRETTSVGEGTTMSGCRSPVVRLLFVVIAILAGGAVVVSILTFWNRFPLTRPTFCDRFEKDQGQLLPAWHLTKPFTDTEGNWAWADKQDVVLLVVVPGERKGGRTDALRSGQFGCRVKVGADRENRYVRLPRLRDTLAVVLPDGSVRTFALGGKIPLGLFKYHLLMNGRGESSILDCAGGVLGPTEKAEFETFRAGLQSRFPALGEMK